MSLVDIYAYENPIATYAAAAGVWQDATTDVMGSGRTVIAAPIFRDPRDDHYRDFSRLLRRTMRMWLEDMRWKVVVPTRSLAEAYALDLHKTHVKTLHFCNAWAIVNAWSKRLSSWLHVNAYHAGCITKLATVAFGLAREYNMFILDWDVLCHRDPMLEMLTMLNRPHVHILSPANARKQLGQQHHFDTFLLAKGSSDLAKGVYRHARHMLEKLNTTTHADYNRYRGDMGLVSLGMERVAKVNGTSGFLTPRFEGVEEVPMHLLITGRPDMEHIAIEHCYHLAGPDKSLLPRASRKMCNKLPGRWRSRWALGYACRD